MEPTLIPTLEPTLNPTHSPTHNPTTHLATEVPSKQNDFMRNFMIITILIIFITAFGCIGCYCQRNDKKKSRHRRLEDALRGIEIKSIGKRKSGGEYSGLLND